MEMYAPKAAVVLQALTPVLEDTAGGSAGKGHLLRVPSRPEYVTELRIRALRI
jgi:hypothetical protein